MRMFSQVVIVALIMAGASADVGEDLVRRYKRAASSSGGEACMQIYTVPKRTVTCDPSQETKDEMDKIHTDVSGHQSLLEMLRGRIDELDPDKEKELPEAVKERLADIETVRNTQVGHTEFLKRLETELAHAIERIQQIESSDRAELAGLIELQTNLIEIALHKANLSLHDAYVDKLADSTTDLSSKLTHLELNLRKEIHDAESKMEVSLHTSEENQKSTVEELSGHYKTLADSLQKDLNHERQSRVRHENETASTAALVDQLETRLTILRERQAGYDATEGDIKTEIENLQKESVRDKDSKMQMLYKTEHLTEQLDAMEDKFLQLQNQINTCQDKSSQLSEELNSLKNKVNRREHLLPRILKVADCQDALTYFNPVSGVYSINPFSVDQPRDVYCEMEQTEAWTIIQRRQNGTEDFFRGWNDYKDGFGRAESDYWLGLQLLHIMTTKKPYKLRVDLQDWEDKWWYAEYEHFFIDDESSSYTLRVSGYHGDAGDSMSYHNGAPFSTMDRNHDKNDGVCAILCRGAWWYKDCFHSNLNGHYYNQGPYQTASGWGDGVVWRHIQNTNFYSLKTAVMKIKPGPQVA